ncbi:MAG: hypothetical protein ACOY4R_31430 [Pseudomonadota bacterium]
MIDPEPKSTELKSAPLASAQPRKGMVAPSAAIRREGMVGIVVTVDHVYLPVGPDGNVDPGWTASNVLPSRVWRAARLRVPEDLARFLRERGQAEFLP